MLSVSAKLHLHFCEVKHQCWSWSRRVSLPLARDSHQVHYDKWVRLANILRHNVQHSLCPGAHHHNLGDREAETGPGWGSPSRKDTKVGFEGVTGVTRRCDVMMCRRDRGCGMSRECYCHDVTLCHTRPSLPTLTTATDWYLGPGCRSRSQARAGAPSLQPRTGRSQAAPARPCQPAQPLTSHQPPVTKQGQHSGVRRADHRWQTGGTNEEEYHMVCTLHPNDTKEKVHFVPVMSATLVVL